MARERGERGVEVERYVLKEELPPLFEPDESPPLFEPDPEPPEAEPVQFQARSVGGEFRRAIGEMISPEGYGSLLGERRVEIADSLNTQTGEMAYRPYDPSQGHPPAGDFPDISLAQFLGDKATFARPTLKTARRRHASRSRLYDFDVVTAARGGDKTAKVPKPKGSFLLVGAPLSLAKEPMR